MLLLFSGVKRKLGAIKFVNVNFLVPHIYLVNPECSVREHYNNIRLFCFFFLFFFLSFSSCGLNNGYAVGGGAFSVCQHKCARSAYVCAGVGVEGGVGVRTVCVCV